MEKLLLTKPKLLLQQIFNWHQMPAYFCSSQIILILLFASNSLFGIGGHFIISSVSLSQEKICFATPVASERTQGTGTLGIHPFQKVMNSMAHPGAAGFPGEKGVQTGSQTSANNLVLLSISQSKCPKHMTFLCAFQAEGSSIPRLHT